MMLDLRLLNNTEEITTPTTFSAFSGPAFVIPPTPPHATQADVGYSSPGYTTNYELSGSAPDVETGASESATAASSGTSHTATLVREVKT